MFDLKFKQVTNAFFDAAMVTHYVDEGEIKTLSRIGAYVRTTARGFIRRGKTWDDYSKPGKPPKSHGDDLLKKLILFSYDRSARSVVIGPTALNGGEKGIPALLEFGGTVHRENRFKTRRGKRLPRRYTATYEPRPYMGPAEEKNRNKFPDLFENAFGP